MLLQIFNIKPRVNYTDYQVDYINTSRRMRIGLQARKPAVETCSG